MLIIFISVLSCCLLLASPISGGSINVWPMPRNFSWPEPQASLLSPNFNIKYPHHRYLSSAAKRYQQLILSEHHLPLVNPSSSVVINTSVPPLLTLVITVSDLTAPLHHGVDESYTLTIPAAGGTAHLTSQTAWGAMRGLETLSQLVWGNPSLVAVGVYVWDAPLFGHRGIMLDTSRNYFGVEDILRTIETMSANKLNVFHWHITDSQSFPLVLPSEPELASKGSYGSNMQYSLADITKIVEFGLEHGVRVYPEIDTPGQDL